MLQMARQIALNHHERWNGGGYPSGLAGPAIPEAARIMAIVDTYDSLTHHRVYRPAMSEEEALEIMRHGEGEEFDPACWPSSCSTCPSSAASRPSIPTSPAQTPSPA